MDVVIEEKKVKSDVGIKALHYRFTVVSSNTFTLQFITFDKGGHDSASKHIFSE